MNNRLFKYIIIFFYFNIKTIDISKLSDVDALKALYEYTEQADGSFARPLGEFPTLEI